MKRTLTFWLLAVWQLGCGDTPTTVAIPVATRIAQLESNILPAAAQPDTIVLLQTLAARMAHYEVPGVSIAVFTGGQFSWARGYGYADVGAGRSVTPETLFQAASISKPVAALGALRLVEGGILGLDEDVNSRLTRWQVPEGSHTASEKVTLRRLLNHTAGTTVWGFPGYAKTPLPSTVDVLNGVGNTDSVTVYKEPGASWQYSGGGYTIVELLMSEVAGQPFAPLMDQLVLQPVGMANSRYEHPLGSSWHARAAVAYGEGGQRIGDGWHHYAALAAAGLWTTPSDLAQFALRIQGAFAGARDRLLSRALVQVMLSPGMNDWGLGLAISKDRLRFGHGGSNRGYRCQLWAYLDGGNGIVVMTNSDNGDALIGEIVASAAKIYGWPGL